jgi:hypothetical protein
VSLLNSSISGGLASLNVKTFSQDRLISFQLTQTDNTQSEFRDQQGWGLAMVGGYVAIFVGVTFFLPNILTCIIQNRPKNPWWKEFTLESTLRYLRSSRRKSWENEELDLIEGYKFISFCLCLLSATILFLVSSPDDNAWAVLNIASELSLAVVVSSHVVLETFNLFSTFFAALRCFQIIQKLNSQSAKLGLEGQNHFLGVGDIFKLYLRKFLRIAPFYYLVLFAGWLGNSFISDAQVWQTTNDLWATCQD